MTERLWAPWRLAYVANAKKQKGCVFCEKPSDDDQRSALVLYQGHDAFIILNAFPYSNGHLMVAPRCHTANLDDLSVECMTEIMKLVRLCVNVLKDAYRPDGFNIGVNLGASAGAGIADHVHFHVVPRWNGDTNFMPVLSDVRVIPQGLGETYDQLHQILERFESEGRLNDV